MNNTAEARWDDLIEMVLTSKAWIQSKSDWWDQKSWLQRRDLLWTVNEWLFFLSSAITSSDRLLSWKPSCWRWCISADRFWSDRREQVWLEQTCGVAMVGLPAVRTFYLLIFALFLQPSPPSQWLLRVPLVIMLPQVTQGFPLAYGCGKRVGTEKKRQYLDFPHLTPAGHAGVTARFRRPAL